MRLFVALDVEPEGFRDELADIRGRVECPAKFVDPDKLHVTLKFLGEMERSRLPELREKLDPLEGFGKFPAWLRGLGAFPRPGSARVLWMGVDSPRLVELASAVRAQLKGTRESRHSFHPHLTLARIKADNCDLSGLVKEYKGKEFDGFRASSFALKESILTPSGPKYKAVHEVEL